MRFHFATVRLYLAAADRVRAARGRLGECFAGTKEHVVLPEPPRRSALDQWQRLTGVLSEAQSRADHALKSHRGAGAQLDAATYALQRLREEMAPAFRFTGPRPAPLAPAPLRSEPFRRREPLAA